LSSKLSYEQAIDFISNIYGSIHENDDATDPNDSSSDGIEPMETASAELDELLTQTREAS